MFYLEQADTFASSPHLQCIWLGKVGRPSDPHDDPDVHHLSRDVAQRQVADHHLLSLRGVVQLHVFAGGEGRPSYLRRKK